MEENKQTTTAEQTTTAPETKTYSQEEFEKALQSETDRRVSMALQKKEKEMSKKLSEAEKLAKMSEEDKFRYQLEQKEQELAAKEREFLLRDNKMAAMKVLADKEIPVDLVEFVVAEDADVMNANINKLDKYIKNAVAAQVKARLASSTPTKGLTTNNEMTKEAFNQLSFPEKLALRESNIELYNKMMGK